MNSIEKRVCGSLAFASLLALASGAHAQSTSASVSLEEVVVTAQKREQKLQDVPLSITAASGEQLQQLNLVQVTSLTQVDPSLNFDQAAGPASSAFSIRGIGTATFGPGVEESVSTVLDGVVLSVPSSLKTITDIERVEVLRGPQGMLFGKNASAGVINVVTKKPELGKFEGIGRLTLGQNNEQVAEAIVNVPVGDTVAIRANYSYNHLDGWIKGPVFDNNPLNDIDVQGGMVKVLWQPSDAATITLAGDIQRTDEYCCAYSVRVASPTSSVARSLAQFGRTPGPDNVYLAANQPATGYHHIYGLSLTGDFRIGDYTLTSLTGWRRSQQSTNYDVDYSTFYYTDSINRNNRDNWSEELRLTSPLGERFDYIVGLYYYDQSTDNLSGLLGDYCLPGPTTLTCPPPATQQSIINAQQIDETSYAAFTQGTVHITDTLDLVLGGRYTNDDSSLVYRRGSLVNPALPMPGGYATSGFSQNGYFGVDGPFAPTATPCVRPGQNVLPAQPNCFPALRQNVGADNFSYRVIVQNKFTPDIMAYASFAKGYKGPGFSALGLSIQDYVSGNFDQRIRPEIPTAYEVGLKSQIFDHRLQLNAAVFYTTYEGYQAQTLQDTPTGIQIRIQNAGEVKTQGVELNSTWIALDHLSFDTGATYLEAEFGDFPGVPCYATPLTATRFQPGCPASGRFNAEGNAVPNSPKWKYFVRANYDQDDLIGSLTGFGNIGWVYRDKVNYSSNGDPSTVQEGFGMLGAQLGIAAADQSWRVSLYGSNILDKRWSARISPAPTQSINPYGYMQSFSSDSFRHLGVKGEMRF